MLNIVRLLCEFKAFTLREPSV